jgi:hypothetical protein
MDNMKKTSEIHIRLSQDNANKVLRLSRKHNMSYSAVANQLLDQVDVSNITVETKVETKTETVVIKKIIL